MRCVQFADGPIEDLVQHLSDEEGLTRVGRCEQRAVCLPAPRLAMCCAGMPLAACDSDALDELRCAGV